MLFKSLVNGTEAPAVEKKNRQQKIWSIILITFFAVYGSTTFFIAANFQNVLFAVRRPDIIEAAKKVEREENRIISEKIMQARKETLQKILSPLVVKTK
jgi:hypothetical protein